MQILVTIEKLLLLHLVAFMPGLSNWLALEVLEVAKELLSGF